MHHVPGCAEEATVSDCVRTESPGETVECTSKSSREATAFISPARQCRAEVGKEASPAQPALSGVEGDGTSSHALPL